MKPLLDPPPPGCVQAPSIGDAPLGAKDFPYPPDTVHVACVLHGDWPGSTAEIRERCPDLGAHYVECLYGMVSKYMPPGTPWRFTCFTDRRFIHGIPTRPLPAGLEGTLAKLYVFSRDAFPQGARVVLFDLDTCITGSLKGLVEVPLSRPVFLRDVWRPELPASGVGSWLAGFDAWRIWDEYAAHIGRRTPFAHPAARGSLYGPTLAVSTDEHWLYPYVEGWQAWQDLLPTDFVSYKYHILGLSHRDGETSKLTPEQARAAKVVYFHGHPRPHSVIARWNPFWRGILDAPAPVVTAGRVSSGI